MPYGEVLNHRLQIWNGFWRNFRWSVQNNVRHLSNLARTAKKFGLDLNGAQALEVGTGWTPTLPIGIYLLGAEIHTYDHLPHLRANNLRKLLTLYVDFLPTISESTGVDVEVLQARLASLREAEQECLGDWLRLFKIYSHAPGDAARTDLLSDSLDLHFSIAVLEHVSEASVRLILEEARRTLKPHGLSYHHIGLHDHYTDFDPTITRVNFLRYGDFTWRILGQNKIQFHNRLRRSEFVRMFQDAGFEILQCESEVDPASLQALETMRLNKRYRTFDKGDLATYVMTICARRAK